MNYQKKIFRKYYGRIYIVLSWLFIVTSIVFIAIGQIDAPMVRIISATIVGSCMMIGLPLTLCVYLRKRNQSARQKQWIKDDILYIQFVIDDGLTAGGFVRHEKLFEINFHEIKSIRLSNRYIILQANAFMNERFNNNVKRLNVSVVSIPRVFDNEDIIISIGGAKNGDSSKS